MDLEILDDIENYRRLFVDASFWQPYVLSAFNKVGLPCKDVRGGIAGTCPTFIVDDLYVIKFFGRLFDGGNAFRAELYASQLLRQIKGVPIAELIAQGALIESDQEWNWPFLVYKYLEGTSIGEAWGQISQGQKLMIAKELGRIVRRIHSVPLIMSASFERQWGVFRQFLGIQRSACVLNFKQKEGLPPHLLQQLEAFLLPVDLLIDDQTTPHLIHADLTRDHLLGILTKDHWTTSGLIDFGDARVGNIFYELVALHMDLFQRDRNLLRVFLRSYGLDKSLYDGFSVRAMNYLLLHQFGNSILSELFQQFPDVGQVETLEDLADELWGIS